MEKEERKRGRRELGVGLWMDADSGASVHGKLSLARLESILLGVADSSLATTADVVPAL
jgi:hypothetical protein